MDAQLRALADPTRRTILALAWEDGVSAGQLAAHFQVSRPAISQHLKVLLDAALVSVRKDGTRRFYKADHDAMADLRDQMARLGGSLHEDAGGKRRKKKKKKK
jgi:DNA-binding transcriptional ArsR family regulator